MYFKPFDYSSIFQYSVKNSTNDLEINSTNKIDVQMAYDNVWSITNEILLVLLDPTV